MCWKHETQFVTSSDDLIEGLMDNLRLSLAWPALPGLFFLFTPPGLCRPGDLHSRIMTGDGRDGDISAQHSKTVTLFRPFWKPHGGYEGTLKSAFYTH